MVFIRGDIYTSSGSTPLFNSWTPYVSKFDTSTFYNWEEDNVPLYDLEERTYELWEQQGFPTSSVPGFALVVSGGASTADLQANSRIFTTVSSCIAALPKVIRFPVLIEVANFGDLGALELHDFRLEEKGSIEIINRNFVRDYTSSSLVKSVASVGGNTLLTSYESGDVSGTLFSGTSQDCSISALSISSTVNNGGGRDALYRYSAVNSVLYPQFTDRVGCLNVGIKNASATFFPGTVGVFGIETYEQADTDTQLATTDVRAVNQFTDARLLRGVPVVDSTKAGGNIYGNTLSKLSVRNCVGPIYIRNFFVDGESGIGETGQDNGIEVSDSEVVLENCTAVRCNNAGFYLQNSNVTLSRSAFSYRNYSRDTTTTRVTEKGAGLQAFNSHITLSAVVSGTHATNEELRPPYAFNPGLDLPASGYDTVFSMSRNYVGIELHNSRLDGGLPRSSAPLPYTGGMLNTELNTGYGLIAKNSSLNIKGLFDIYGNKKGVKLNNTELEVEQICVEDHTSEGFICDNSKVLYNTFIINGDSVSPGTTTGQATRKQYDFRANGQHLVLRNNSSFELKRKNHLPEKYGHMIFSGAHGVVNNATGIGFGILPAISLESNSYANFIHSTMYRAAADVAPNTVSPGMLLRSKDSSEAEFFGTKNGATVLVGPSVYSKQQFVAGIAAENNSKLGLHGPTCIAQFGVDALVENNSILDIGPPRVRDTYALDGSGFDLSAPGNHTSVELHSTRACLVANHNSVINMNDCGDYHNFWGEYVHGRTMLMTMTQDYKTNDNLNVSGLIKNGSIQFYPNPQIAAGITSNYLDDLTGNAARVFSWMPFPTFTAKTRNNQYLITTDFLAGAVMSTEELEDVTQGGVCVRAVDGSKVNVTNVHFPVGTANSPLDGVYYNASGDTCSRLMIWNMADSSELKVAFTSVSGCYPSDVGYHGPSAVWTSALAADDATPAGLLPVPASGAPSGTPDTGRLSVLDTFGRGSVSGLWLVPSGVGVNDPFGRYFPVSGHLNDDTEVLLGGAGLATAGNLTLSPTTVYGASGSSFLNQGVFRIYFSPNSCTKFLAHDATFGYTKGAFPHNGAPVTWMTGAAGQVFAQGYNMSAPVSAVVPVGSTSLSSLYPNLLKISDWDATPKGSVPTGLAMSGFYYCKEFLNDNPTQCMLDESAGNTFANAKNSALGGSGRPKRSTIYRSGDNTEIGSEAYDGSAIKGFRSANIFDLKRID